MIDHGKHCLGCTACQAACPKDAIRMQSDRDGFIYPFVDQDLCVDCGLCDKACPLNGKSKNNFEMNAYAVQHKDKAVLQESTSGGMFTALSDLILEQGGVVYGAALDPAFKVMHIRAESTADRNRCRGSKYVQSDLGDMFSFVKQDLQGGRPVLFTGTPCQVDGLRHFLQKDYKNLYLCDLICHGTWSPLVWKNHVEMLEKQNHSQMVGYKFRPKDWGWEVHNEVSFFENGGRCHSNAYSTLSTTIYYSKLAHRPCCHECQYSNLERVSDITIADCRGIEKRESVFHTYDGVSLVLINSAKGAELFSNVKDATLYQEIDINDFMQPPLRGPSKKNARRELFWNEFHANGYWAAVKKIYGKHYVLKYNVKKVLKKLHITK